MVTMVSVFFRQSVPRFNVWLKHLSTIPCATQQLLDLGFSEEQATKIHSLIPRKGDLQQKVSCVRELLLLGMDNDKTLRMLEASPEIFKVSSKQIKDRADNLRKLGLGEGTLQVSLSRCPSILTMPSTRILAAAQCLKQRCQFSTQQVSKILHVSPETLTQDPDYIEEVFQYVYFRMGGTHKDILTSGLFLTSLDEIKVRHQFLERLGRFLPPNKKGECPTSNPKIKDIVNLSENNFLSSVACSSPEEFHTFQKIVAREEAEAREEDNGETSGLDTDDEGEDSVQEESDSDDEDTNRNIPDKTIHK
ncbi:transcription termination factor 4, mitochondrial isoform X2 [Pelobates fuscus]|uniref:transcription termination factor 4, mitochondrial isoform X2 n=1 Tax=Pelobates fuscus TaxID=191477 RepID=UPI002FE4334F